MKSLPNRLYSPLIQADLKKKMVFMGGPRQVGKTTLAKQLLSEFSKNPTESYLNWDNELDRQVINKVTWPKDQKLIVFDEIHKRRGWQRLIKGFWDKWNSQQNYLITGSAQLDTFRKSGDSMLGRYHYFRIHPFSLPELGNTPENLMRLFKFGGFPEPLIEGDERFLRRWQLQRVSKLVRVDLRDLENVSDLDKVELLALSLPSRAATQLSYRSLSEDLEVSDKTLRRWVSLLNTLYYSFTLAPYGSPKIKAIKKAQKVYLWDWSQVELEGSRFENMVASLLLKFCHYQQDVEGYRYELRYLRDETGKECDFIVLKDQKPEFAVECKLSPQGLDPNIHYFRKKLKVPHWYQVHLHGDQEELLEPDIQILSFSKFCKKIQAV